MSSVESAESEIRLRRTIESYYESWESYFGYKLALDGAQHYGYYDKDTYWPFPIPSSLTRYARFHPKLFLLGID
jgi:sterol 24-C-methyltransferase